MDAIMNGKRILYLSYDGMTDPLGQSQVLPYLRGLSKKGYIFTLVSFEKPEIFEKNRAAISEICQEADIQWVPHLYTKKPPVLSTLKDVRVMKRTAKRLHRKTPFDLVHCRSYITALAGLWLKKRTGIPFLFDMRGFWADERVDGGLWPQTNVLYRSVYQYFKRAEKRFLQEADAIVSLTYAGKDEIQSWGLATPEITVIPCCVDTTLFDPTRSSEVVALRRQLNFPENAPVLGYVGSLGTWYELPEMLEFFAVWLRQHPESVLLFVTKEPEEMIRSAAKLAGIPQDKLRIRAAVRSEMPSYISLMDFGLFFIRNAFSKKASSPVKQGELMAMGLPVICNAGVGDTDKIVEDYNAGALIRRYSTADYEAAIEKITSYPYDRSSIRAGAIDYFDLEKGIASYQRVYEKLRV